ncbi:MAG TPA: glycerate kinase [Gemmatimonadales bacterium]|nr:glycerate kinase [Gemmatimonadales bacterium]
MSPSRVLAVAQAFKGSLSARTVADAYAEGIRAAGGDPHILLASDGGDGLLDALESQLLAVTDHDVAGPLGDRITAPIGWLDARTAVVESRYACGLSVLGGRPRDPLRATTLGVGQLVVAAAEAGAERVYVGLGGSATMDGGVGMACAWGVVPRDVAGVALPGGGGALERLAALEDGSPPAARVVGLADVSAPLLGPAGARRYARQKGADVAAEARLARGLERLAAVLGARGTALAARPGAGAAGGLGFGLLAFLDAELVPGAAWVLDQVGWADAVSRAALVVTGEGAFDATSSAGKLTGEVLTRAAAAGRPAALVAPTVRDAPQDVVVEQGGGRWDEAALAAHTRAAVARALRLPPS